MDFPLSGLVEAPETGLVESLDSVGAAVAAVAAAADLPADSNLGVETDFADSGRDVSAPELALGDACADSVSSLGARARPCSASTSSAIL